MLEIEYELIRQEGNGHERIFHTDDKLKKIEGNATYIKAPNARGKSTLLNILALSLYGDRLDESDSRISESLRSDIEYLSSRKNQICTFNVKFTSKDGKIELISTKKNAISNDIEVKEIINGKERYLPFHKFREEYFLVYDIPEDPLNRIPEILSEVKNQQYRYHKKIQDFIRYLGEIKSEIANSRDEDEIIRTKTSISEYEDKKLNFKRSIDEIREQIRILESFLALREFERYVEFSFSLNESIENKGKIKSNRKKTAKTFNTRYENKRKHIKGKIDKIKMNISDLTYNLNNLFFKRDSREIEPHVEYLKNFDMESSLETFQLDKSIHTEIEYFRKQLINYLSQKEIKESGKKGSFYHELIHILEQYKSMDISLPGLEKSIDEFTILLKEEYDKNEKFKSIYDELNESLNIIKEIEKELNEIPNELESLKIICYKKEEKSLLLTKDDEVDSEIDELKGELERTLSKVSYYKDLADKNGILINEDSDPAEVMKLKEQIFEQNANFEEIFRLGEDQFLREIQKIKQYLEVFNAKYSNNENILAQYSAKLLNLESRKPHKFQTHSGKINNLSRLVDALDQKLTNYNSIVQKIEKKEKLSSDIEIQYNEEISLYFAKKISEFPYIDEFVKPQKIDFLNKSIILEGKREIDMKDISTGQSMSLYIQAVLKRPKDDNRKMVVIFDEGATMDSNSLKPIQKILKKQIEENKILFAIFAKAVDEELSITDLV